MNLFPGVIRPQDYTNPVAKVGKGGD